MIAQDSNFTPSALVFKAILAGLLEYTFGHLSPNLMYCEF